MPLNIKNAEAHLLARRLAQETGLSITEAVTRALREALDKSVRAREQRTEALRRELDRIAADCSTLAILDKRSADEILGYDEHGLPS